MSTINHLYAHMHLKKHIRMNVIADLNMSIFYFKKRPFIVMDLSNEKIYFNDNGLEWLRSEKQIERPVQWTRSKYLPSKNWVGLTMDNEKNDLIIQLIDEFYLATCDMLLRNPIRVEIVPSN